jgi:transcription elongation factor GreB
MSKAFTRESDDERDEPTGSRGAVLPPGVKNYLTPHGATVFRLSLEELQRAQRSVAKAATAEDAEANRKMRVISQRMRELSDKLRGAEIVPPPAPPWEQVRFGAFVRVRDESGAETNYRIVGLHEMDIDQDWVSYVSPIARALLNRRVGEQVKIKVPAGERTLEILGIVYPK